MDLAKCSVFWMFFFFQAEDGIRDIGVTGVQTCALPISPCTGRRAQVSDRRRCDVGLLTLPRKGKVYRDEVALGSLLIGEVSRRAGARGGAGHGPTTRVMPQALRSE